MEARSNQAPLVVVVGETASGKSSLAMLLASKFNGEIVSADSWMVYKEFDIGTAKPTPQEQTAIPHHLLDIADPHKGFNAATYKRLAQKAIRDIGLKAKLPILVGGTGLYIDSVLFDYSFLPPATPEIRKALNSFTLEQLLLKIDELNLDTTGIDLRNKRRLIRLIEVNGKHPVRATMRSNTLIIGVNMSRVELNKRVLKRIDGMFRDGLIGEVLCLSKKYGWNVEPMKGIGYSEFYEYFNGTKTIEETRAKIMSSTLNLAKRQRTWFKRNKSIHWINKESEAVDLVTTVLNK